LSDARPLRQYAPLGDLAQPTEITALLDHKSLAQKIPTSICRIGPDEFD
jgi:hypothetical protein